ncbi:MAG: SPOR domain-containing protein [Geobacteraceae bacterium]|nr:SPOR domain-containing protein [Geobacteraceae bacterium]
MVETGLPQKREKTGLAGEGGSSAKGILLVLAALAVCFGYFYFFTDIFRSKDEIAGQRDIISSEVRKAMPARSGATPQATAQGKSAAPAVPETGSVKPAEVAVPPQPTASQSKQPSEQKAPAAGMKAKAVPASGKLTEKTAAVKAGDAQKKAPAAKTPDKQQKPRVATAKTAEKPPKTSTPAQKNGDAKKGAAGKTAAAPVKTATVQKTGTDAEKTPAAAPAPSAVKKTGGAFTLVIGTYVLKSSMTADKAKLERAGFKQVSVVAKKRSEPMNRLYVADFSTQSEAQAELNRVRNASKDAFVLKENGRYSVYAGSYYAYERAMEMREQLNGKGLNPTIRKSVAPVPTYTLTGGSFSSREDALEEAAKLKKLGFKPFVSARK